MKPEDILARLRAHLPHVDDLIAGEGNPLWLAATLLPEVPAHRVRAAADGILPHADPELANVEAAEGEDRIDRFAFVLALARIADRSTLDPKWADRVDDVLYDVLGRPRIYRDLSDAALSMLEALELAEGSIAGRLCTRTARAALDAPSEDALAHARRLFLATRRKARVQAWLSWIADRTDAAFAPLREALDVVAGGAAPLAAADGTPDALARIAIGEGLQGEITLAVTAHGLLVEWDGDGVPPDTCAANGRPLESASDQSLAAMAWTVPAPNTASVAFVVERGTDSASVRWPRET